MPRKHPPFPVLCSLATHEHARVKERMARGSSELPSSPPATIPLDCSCPTYFEAHFTYSLAAAMHTHSSTTSASSTSPSLSLIIIIFRTSLPYHHHRLHHHNPSPIAISTARQHKKKARSLRAGRAGALSQSHSFSRALCAERVFTFALIMLSWPCLLIELPCARLPSCSHLPLPPFLVALFLSQNLLICVAACGRQAGHHAT